MTGRSRWLGALLITLAVVSALPLAVPPVSSQETAAPAEPQVSPQRAVVNKYCVTCHNQKLKTADLLLDQSDVDHPAEHPEIWEKVVRKLRGRAMPPGGAPRPDEATYESVAGYLESTLDKAAATSPDPGRTNAAHRLNRAEYANAVRDMLGLEIDAATVLPADDSGGFDNLGDLLSVSPGLMEKYISAAARISRLAVGDPTIRADSVTYTVSPYLVQSDRMNEDMPFGSRGGVAIHHEFPLDGEYDIKIRLQRTDGAALVLGLAEPHALDVRLDDARVKLFQFGGQNVGVAEGAGAADALPPDYKQSEYERHADEQLEVRFPAKAGRRLVQVAFLKERWVPEGAFDIGPQMSYAEEQKTEHRGITEPKVSSVVISGPYDATGAANTPSRRKIFICTPANSADEETCARKILAALARRAYRRPVTDADVDPLMGLYRQGKGERGFESGVQMAVQGVLVSTGFLFRIETEPAKIAPNTAYRVSDLDLASRLSFFLWSSIPDEELLSLAEKGKLHDAEVLEQQVHRMLADPRANALVDNFAGQWLYLRNIKTRTPNRDLYPDFDDSLRQDFETETDLFLKSIMRDDRSVLNILSADYTFVNERLANFYGIPKVYGSQFRRVAITDENRKGLLGQGSVLLLTSYANRTSVVQRGKWVLENILAAPPPPPPPNVPPLKERSEGAKGTLRQQMEEHRKNPFCFGCHARMDPIGFALENFNAIGQWRDVDDGNPIDPSGVLVDGSKFEGLAGLRTALLKHPDNVAYAVSEKLMTYALGRTTEYYDGPALRKIVRDAAPSEYRWSAIVVGIVKSTPFQMRRSRTL
jgi:cytochrome c5